MDKQINWKRHYYKHRIFASKYYVIRRESTATGLFSLVNTHLGHIDYAIKKGYFPVIDMMNYSSCYLDEKDVGIVNAWDRLFEQPVGITVEEAYKGKTVILSCGDPIDPRPDDDLDFFNNKDGKLEYWRKLAHQYIRINPTVLKHINDEYRQLFSENDRVLGVLVRGTDYIAKKPYIHPVQPQPSEVIEKCKTVMAEQNCNKLFIATEDKSVLMMFEKEFGDRCLTNKRRLVDYQDGMDVPTIRIDREDDCYIRGVEYLTTIAMLSKSYAFVGGRTSGSVGAMLLSDGFKYQYIFDLGRYGTDENW